MTSVIRIHSQEYCGWPAESKNLWEKLKRWPTGSTFSDARNLEWEGTKIVQLSKTVVELVAHEGFVDAQLEALVASP